MEPTQARCATLTRTGPNEVEVRFTAGVALDRAGIAEVIRERKHMCSDAVGGVGVLLILPWEMELDMGVIDTDHLKVNQGTDHVLGFAVVAGNTFSETLLRLYKALYPTAFISEVFRDEEQARRWLRARVALEVAKV